MADTPTPHRRLKIHGLTPARKLSEHPSPKPPSPDAPAAPFLVGHGYDIHRLQPGGKLILVGVIVSDQMSAVAHSDGDVILHAVVDALLGAMGWGDIGQHFPDHDPRWENSPSRVFVEEVYTRIRQAGYRLSNLDITLQLERPKIAPFRAQMIDTLHRLFEVSHGINLKAGTNEGCDAVGRGEAVSAQAVVLLASGR